MPEALRRQFAFDSGRSRMAQRVLEHDWAATPLGPISGWPDGLRLTVGQIMDSRFPAAVVWGTELTTIYNDAFQPILGRKPEALGRSFAEVWSEVWDEVRPIADRAFAGEATYIEDFPLVIDRYGRPEEAWFTFCYSPLRASDGTVAGFLDTVTETTATVQARADLALVNEELHHRLQNTLALVHAIATQSLRAVEDREAVEKFRTRIVALGRAHQVLLSKSWAGASLDEVAPRILTPIADAGRITIAGPPVTVGARATVSLAMILHELASNAAMHGALSVSGGSVGLSWDCRDGRFQLAWRERGGPPVPADIQPGYGWRLIDRVLGPNCRVTRRTLAEGVELDLEVPLAELTGA
jgi:two-component sensor histidine kinase